ncbi:ER membrane protein complex subunit 8 isoform X2 [Arvicola amphibius]|uniref:ER membrane protein complex subunit 8 isoform X2 n=1 Tax=Arvicola amphibius TaxID=1047088 RepID=UPI0018E2D700|nr:ER membrane protein complex subunit 8 isoform X2 [Arvicola amphibius]
MPGVKLTTQAYCKMVLHGAKYPHCAVNGLLVAERQRPRKEHPPGSGSHTLFVDCIPLFHGTLALAPMLEVALTLIDSWCKENSYVIAGYYQANERVKDARGFLWLQPARSQGQLENTHTVSMGFSCVGRMEQTDPSVLMQYGRWCGPMGSSRNKTVSWKTPTTVTDEA